MDTTAEQFEKEARKEGYSKIAGIDEAGRGPLAGPVVAAAIILPEQFHLPNLDDSKRLTPQRREQLFDSIYDQAVSIGLGIVDPAEIDRMNILQAALSSMCMAVDNLRPAPDFLLIDGTFQIKSPVPQRVIKYGDRRSPSIAAASIIAKVTRDRLMSFYDKEFPEYCFGKNKGYGTREHRAAIRNFGCCWIHRKTFRGVREHVQYIQPCPLLVRRGS